MDIVAFLLELKNLRIIFYCLCALLVFLGGVECLVKFLTIPNVIFGAIGAGAALAGIAANYMSKKQLILIFIVVASLVSAMFIAAIVLAVIVEHSMEALIGGIVNLCVWIVTMFVAYLVWRQTSPDGYEIV